jgi:hypothetical protein
VVGDRSSQQEEAKPTIANRPLRLPGRPSNRVTTWLLGAILVAVVATTLAVSIIGSGGQQTDQPVNSQQAAPQGPTPFGGAHP